MSRSQWLRLTLGVGIGLSLVSCRKQSPIDEIRLSDSGVEVADVNIIIDQGDWPGWRGNLMGIAVDQEVATAWDEENNVVWRTRVPGRGHSSPVVAGNLVVLGTAIKSSEEQLVLAYDRNDGTEVWRTVVHRGGFPANRKVHQKATNANGTVAFDGELFHTAFLNSDKIFATALDQEGHLVWQQEIGDFDSKFGFAPSPVLYKSLVIVAADNFGGGYIAALDRKTGKIAWRVGRGTASSYSSPVVATVGGREQLLITGGDRLASYDPETGEPLWETKCIAESTCGTVVVAEDRIFGAGGYPKNETVCLSADGALLWSNQTKLYEPSLIAYQGHLFAITDDGIAYCWAVSDGELKWRKRLGGNFSGSPVICNGNIYVANLSGDCFVFAASGDKYQLVSKNHLGDDCYASPAICGGQLFLRIGIGQDQSRTEELVCIGTAKVPVAN